VYLYIGISVLIKAEMSELVYLYIGIGVLIKVESIARLTFQAS